MGKTEEVNIMISLKLCSPLAKIFPEQAPPEEKFRSGMALRGEKFSFQLAYRVDSPSGWRNLLHLKIESPLQEFIRVRKVETVPVRFFASQPDDDVISSVPGLYPDPLVDIPQDFRSVPEQWNSLWIDVAIPENCLPGKYPVTLILNDMDHAPRKKVRKTFQLEVLDQVLPPQKLIHTEWFHADCLAAYYRCPVWSEDHWTILEKFIRCAAEHGINMLLTPVFTPPLDTAVGGERPTVQLVDVRIENGEYSFDFTRLERWVKLAEKCGITYFEISHLFTQWGAAFCPKIMAEINGETKRIFGWNVKADSPEYHKFLGAFLPALIQWLKEHNLQERTYFHCSDEPQAKHLKTYRKAVTVLRKYLSGFKMCDALSNVEFYKHGLVSTPIPIEDSLDEFVKAGVEDLWTYYCCTQVKEVSNRFVNMPSSRNRITGSLLYRYGCKGFLQWGFNFYFSQFSIRLINPWMVLDSDCAFPPGDAFMVYPGLDGSPVDSLRLEVFFQGLQDLRALELLETKIGRKKVCAFLDRMTSGGKMDMKHYPRGESAVLNLRKKINSLLKRLCSQ